MSKTVSRLSLAVLLASAAGTGGCARTFARPDGAPVYSVSQLKAELSAKGKDFTLPEAGMIVKLDKGSVMPIDLRASVPFATLEPGDNRVRVERDVWLLISPRQMAMSPDGERWARVQDLRAVQQLFGSRGRGAFQIGIGMNQDGPRVTVSVTSPAP